MLLFYKTKSPSLYEMSTISKLKARGFVRDRLLNDHSNKALQENPFSPSGRLGTVRCPSQNC